MFKPMLLSYKLGNSKYTYFKRGQELVSEFQYFLKNQRPDVPSKCLEIQFTTSRIYPSPVGIVDGLNMNKLFSSEQDIPVPSASIATATAGTHLTTITTMMLTVVSGVTSKVATNYANDDTDETIDYKGIPADVCARYNLKNHPINIITSSNLKPFHNDFTMDKHNSKQR